MFPGGQASLPDRDSSRPRASRLAAALLFLLAFAAGCSSTNWVKMRDSPQTPLAGPLNLFKHGGPHPSDRTMLVLRRYDLETDLDNPDPRPLLVKLLEIINKDPSSDKIYSLAELAYLGGKKYESSDPNRALELHTAAMLHAYLYLFDGGLGRFRNAYDPEFRGACDLYNGALDSTLRIIKKQGNLRPGATQTIQTANQTIEFAVVVRGNGWRAEDFDGFDFVSDYEVSGLRNQYHSYGLGVPLIANRKNHSALSAVERYYPPGLSFPVTAFLRLQPHEDGSRTHHVALLELHDPLNASEVAICGQRVPMETDLSTPLAYFLDQPQLQNLDLPTAGLLHPDKAQKVQGLYMLEPYQPGKIPVLMVHGIWSSPITWVEMFNDLRGAPEIRDHFQFWFYLYPTGEPFWYSAAKLRQDLAQMRATIDPQHREPALDQMVLVGHSMGGLVSTLQSIESGNDYWNTVTDQPFERVKAPPEVLANLASTFFFHANPSVRRVITIGTPHHGSKFANSTTEWIGDHLITIPKLLANDKDRLRRDNPGLFPQRDIIDIKTSIDSLSPHSPIFPVMLASKRTPWVKYNNIIGRIKDKGFINRVVGSISDGGDDTGPLRGTDGVVSCVSAHLDAAESELVVENTDHTEIHRHPLTVLEVHRILLEHLSEMRGYPPGQLQRPPLAAQLPGNRRRQNGPANPPSANDRSYGSPPDDPFAGQEWPRTAAESSAGPYGQQMPLVALPAQAP